MADREDDLIGAARSVLVEVVDLLKAYRDAAVVAGGWVPQLLPSKGVIPHVGSTDVDLVLDYRRIPERGDILLKDLLLTSGYRPGRQPFQYHRAVARDIGNFDVRVDLLTLEPEGNPPGDYYQHIQGVEALKVRGLDLVFEMPFETEIRGRLPEGETVTVTLRVASTVPFLVLKGLALFDRRERKDAYDIYHRLKNYRGDASELACEFAPYLSRDVVKESLNKIAAFFASVKSEGPRFVADFLATSDRPARDSMERDAYEHVNSFLQSLSVT
jgi:hypothetical protein